MNEKQLQRTAEEIREDREYQDRIEEEQAEILERAIREIEG